MKAAVFYENGGPEKRVYIENHPEPVMTDTEVLVRVKASCFNHLDIWVRNGIPAYKAPMPHIGGCEGSGIIEKIGARVTQWKPGDEIIICPGQACFECEFCRAGQESTCLNWKVFGAHTQGAFAEYAFVPEKHLISKPKEISFETAAAFPLVYLTSWHMLITRAKLQPGETVLVLGANSGIGTAAIQIAKLTGANVIAASSSAEKLEYAKELGADDTIDYTQTDFMDYIKEKTNGRGVEVVFEHTGSQTFEKSIKSLCRNGRLVICGATTGPEAKFDIRYLFSRQLTVLGSMLGNRNELIQITKLMAQGKLNPKIDSIHPIQDIQIAESRMENRLQFGKIVIKID